MNRLLSVADLVLLAFQSSSSFVFSKNVIVDFCGSDYLGTYTIFPNTDFKILGNKIELYVYRYRYRDQFYVCPGENSSIA